ncbi:fibroblast growth factor receptor-like 1, partial [Leptotrombidium deliense]
MEGQAMCCELRVRRFNYLCTETGIEKAKCSFAHNVPYLDPPRLLPLAENRETRKVVPSGSVVHLSCPVEKTENDELFIDWMKDGESLTTFDPRIRKTSGGTLKIKEVVPEDTGLYLCKVVNGFGSIEIGTTLIVLGQPRPVLTWFHNGKIIREKDMKKRRWTLTLTELQVGDSGNYTCIAFNSYGNASASFQLEVMGLGKKAEIKELYPGNITVIEGAKVTFHCRVHSDIKPHIQWLKRMNPKELMNNHPVGVSDAYRNPKYGQHILEFEGKQFRVLKSSETIPQKDGSFLNRLTISESKVTDFGQYACLGASPYGYDFRSAFLTVINRPTSQT